MKKKEIALILINQSIDLCRALSIVSAILITAPETIATMSTNANLTDVLKISVQVVASLIIH